MKRIIRMSYLLSGIIVFSSAIWFLLASTALFKKDIDLITTVIFVCIWIPALVFIGTLIMLFKKRWVPKSVFRQILLMIGQVALVSIFVFTFLKYSSTAGWLQETVTNDCLQTTDDEKYDYRIELVNIFQSDSYARLFVKNKSDGEEIRIPLNISTKEITLIVGGEGYTTDNPEKYVWAYLEPTENQNRYVLRTTNTLFDDKTYVFEIDLERKIAESK